MIALIGDVVSGMLATGLAVVTATFVVRAAGHVRRHRRLHRRRANKQFMAGYKAAFRQARRTTVEAPAPPAPPVVRPPTPAGAGDVALPTTPASAGSTRRGRHAA